MVKMGFNEKGGAKAMTLKYFVRVTDERTGTQIWVSDDSEEKEVVVKYGRRLAQAFFRSDLSVRKTEGYLDPTWEVSAKGIKKSLHVDVMRKYIEDDGISLRLEEHCK